jgi:hypothetical protein
MLSDTFNCTSNGFLLEGERERCEMYGRTTATKAPTRRRSKLEFEKTEEWSLMKADLEKGSTPDEALQLSPNKTRGNMESAAGSA